MPSLVKLQYFPSPPPGQCLKYEKGWTYVERRPSTRLEICRRTIRSRAPSPEPRPASSRLCIGDHIHLHRHYDSRCCLDEVEPRIIEREPKDCKPASPAPPSRPTSCDILSPGKEDEDKEAKANIAHLSAILIAKQEELDAINRVAKEDRRRGEKKLLEPSSPPRPWEREWERERERQRARETDRQMEQAREEMRAELRDRERARQRAREREEFREREIARLRAIERERLRERGRERREWPRRRSYYYDPHHAANVLERSPVRYC